MKKLPTKTLENAIGVYETTLKVTEDNGEYCYGALDKATLEFLKELKEYRDAEEQGLLLRLPCKVGDTVFCIFERRTKCTENDREFDEYSCQGCECLECDSRTEKYVYEMKAYGLDWIVANLSRFGKTVFLTKEEAEAALEKMKGECKNA